MNVEEITASVIEIANANEGMVIPMFYIQTDKKLIAVAIDYDPASPGTLRDLIIASAVQLARQRGELDGEIREMLYAGNIRLDDRQPQEEQRLAGSLGLIVIVHRVTVPTQPPLRRLWVVLRTAEGAHGGLQELNAMHGQATDVDPIIVFLMAYMLASKVD